ncbi:lipocalin Cav p 2.0101-like [Sorex araneus]|uniref:lipocalin Cav p 2.0101-like n=1 Tax=Sorex araneus TaxID=42254 RepID=UPI002433BB4C|nr:lipocalin Cav p 2.0101-like [Sorex araneus]
MKLVLLALFVAVASAKLHKKNTGEWRFFADSADNKEKIEENGPLRGFLRDVNCNDRQCNSVTLTFWMINNGVCEKVTLVGNRAPGSDQYTTAFEGQNYFTFCDQSKNVLVICIRNTDETGTVTNMVKGAVRPGYEPTDADREMYEKLVKEHGIPLENIIRYQSEDTCPQ